MLDTSLKSELDSKFRNGKTKKNSSKLSDSINKSLKHDSSNKSVLKNNLKKINEKSSSKLHKDSYSSNLKKDKKTEFKSNLSKESEQYSKEKISSIRKINLTKNKSSIESKIVQTPSKNSSLCRKGRETQKADKSNIILPTKNIVPSSYKIKDSINSSKLHSNSNLVLSTNDNKTKFEKTNCIKEPKVKIYLI